MGFSSSSVVWELEVQGCLFCHSFSLIGHSMPWWMVVVANWLIWCQGCLREVFWACSCSSCTLQSFSILENKLFGNADDSTLVAVVPSPGERAAVSESMNRDLNRVSVWCNLWE